MGLERLAVVVAKERFGEKGATDPALRSERLVKKAVELAHANGVPMEALTKVLFQAYSRRPGSPEDELAGVVFCAAVMVGRYGSDLGVYLETELARVAFHPPNDSFEDSWNRHMGERR